MEDVLVKDVVERLSCTSDEAFFLLHQHDWNVQMAIVEATKALDHRVDGTADFLLVNKYKKRNFIGNDTSSSFPDIVKETEMFLKVVEKDIIENSMKRCLEESKHLNWWIPSIGAAHKLFPISTIGDGNCLLHAVSLAMFGVTDRLAILRSLLYDFCNSNPVMEAIQRRWRLLLAHSNAHTQLILSEAEWITEWTSVTSAPTLEKVRSPDPRYIGLEDIHIFILSHLIKRPIVVLAQDYIRNSRNECLAPSNFAGIYIPFECPIEQISRCPIILGFHTGHFAPLVYMDTVINNIEMVTYLLPTMDHNGESLPLKFFIDPGVSFNYSTMISDDMFAINKNDYSKVIRKYFNITNFETAMEEDEQQLLDLEEIKKSKSLRQLELLKSIKKSVLKLKKPKGINVHPHLGSSDLIEIVVKNPENFEKILDSYRFVASARHIANLSEECRKYKSEEAEKNLDRDRDYGFGIGKSRFYREADFESYKAVSNIPKSSVPRDKTLYLAKSTFFNDTEKMSSCEKLNKISSPSDDCPKVFNLDDYIPFVDEGSDLIELDFPELHFDHIILPYSVIKTMNFSDRRPTDKIAAEVADAVLPKLNFIKFC